VPKDIIYQILIFGYFWLYVILNNHGGGSTSNFQGTEKVITQNVKGDFLSERIVFYNTENLFYPSDDSLKADDEFTPAGLYHWTYGRYYNKINKLGKLFVAIGQGHMPAIIGLCEVENRKVLSDILSKSILERHSYKIIHKESPDLRGIDVALLYDQFKFKPLNYDFINISCQDYPELKTRDILYVSGFFHEKALCHIFVNHWPSRRGGKLASDIRREAMAKALKHFVDSCYRQDELSNIIIMGDFNDEPGDQSLKNVLCAEDPETIYDGIKLINLMYPHFKKGRGTHFRVNNFTEAAVLDQIIVSRAIYFGENYLKIQNGQANIYLNEFLVDKKNGKPLRTFQGLKYLGGFSDHLPVYTDIQIIY
jgi:hypothetical protein